MPKRHFAGILLPILLSMALRPPMALATMVTVTTADDELNADGDCALREAIQAANANVAVDACAAGQSDAVDTINVPAGTYTLKLAGAEGNANNAVGDLDVLGDVTITGAGAATTIIQACDAEQQTTACAAGHGVVDRVFDVVDAQVTMSGITVRHGRAGGNPGHGILVRQFNSFNVVRAVSLALTDAVVTKNGTPNTNVFTTKGGGIAVENAVATLTRVTVSDNVLGSGGSGGVGAGIGVEGGLGSSGTPSSLVMRDCTVSGNASGAGGGGIYMKTSTTADIAGTTISGNHGPGGGGGLSVGLGVSGTMTNCTVSGNQSDSGYGAGVFVGTALTFNIRSSTITLNHLGSTGQGGSGLVSSTGTVLRNTIIAGNIDDNPGPNSVSPDCREIGVDAIVSEGHNLLGEALHCASLADGRDGDQIGTQGAPLDAKLGPLADNGGPTATHALPEQSPAIDAADPGVPGSGGTACPAVDQRGETRPAGAACDVGAFEGGGGTVALDVRSVEPARGGNAGTIQVHLQGSGLVTGATAKLVRAGSADVVGASTNLRAGVLTTSFDLRGAAPGAWSVVVVNPDQSTATLTDAFTVEAGGSADLWVDVLLPRRFNGAYRQSIYLVFGNRGNVDAYGVPIWLAFSNELEFHVPFPVTPPPTQPAQIATDWTRIGIDVTIPPPEDRNSFPLLLPVVPAGSTGVLKFRVQNLPPDVSGRPTFRVSTDIGQPYFDPDVSSTVVNQYAERAKQYAAAAHGTTTFPSDDAIATYVRTQLAGVVATASANAVAATGGYPPVYSQAQLIVDTGQFIAGESATTLVPALAPSFDRHWFARVAADLLASSAEARLVEPDCDPLDTFCERYPDCDTHPPLCQDPPLTDCDRIVIDVSKFRFSFVPCTPKDYDRDFAMAFDPNDKVGPGSPDGLIDGLAPLPYAVQFENVATATGDAFRVTVTDQLDTTKYDLATFNLGLISFGDQVVVVPPGLQTFSTEVDLRPGRNILVGITAALDVGTGLVTWSFTTLDPATHEFPENPDVGFLPPNVTQPQGEGTVLFTVGLKPGLPIGTKVCNRGRIVFDFNAPIDTPDFCNRIGTPENCGNCIDDDGDGLVDFEDPSCCTDGQPALSLRRGQMKPTKNDTRLLLTGGLTGTLPDVTATGVGVHLRSADAGEILCARIPGGNFGRKRKTVQFTDKPGTLDGAGGLGKLLFKTRKGGAAAMTLAAKRGKFTTPPAGPITLTLGFGDGSAAGQCSAVTATFRAKKRGVIVTP